MTARHRQPTPIPLPVVGAREGGGQQAPTRPRGEAQLLRAGWVPRFVADERMASDARESYGELGVEVTTLPVEAAAFNEVCAACAPGASSLVVVYTRRSHSSSR